MSSAPTSTDRIRWDDAKISTVSELQDYLYDLAEVGLAHEAGEFTLDAQHARRKMREFQLKQPGLWLLKMAQAALHLNSPAVAVKQNPGYLCVSCQPELSTDALLELLGQIHDMQVLSHARLGHLAWSIQSALASQPHRLTLEVHLDGKAGAFEIDNAGARSVPPPPGLLPGQLQLVRHEAPPRGLNFLLNHFKWLKTSQTDVEALRQRARFFPCPLTLDGLALNDPTPEFCQSYPTAPQALARGELWGVTWSLDRGSMAIPDPAQRLAVPFKPNSKEYAWQSLHWVSICDAATGRDFFGGSPYNFAWAKGQVQGDTFFVPYPRYSSRCSSKLSDREGVFFIERKPLCGHFHITWNVGNQNPGLLIPVHLGVQLDALPIPHFPPGVVIVAASPDWTTDLSQLQLIQDECAEKTITRLLPWVERLRVSLVDLLRVASLSRKCLVQEEVRLDALAILKAIQGVPESS